MRNIAIAALLSISVATYGQSCDIGSAVYEFEDYVKTKLNNPRTAKFPWGNSAHIEQEGRYFTMLSYVDAKNDYGVEQRIYFKIKMLCTTPKWKVISEKYEQR